VTSIATSLQIPHSVECLLALCPISPFRRFTEIIHHCTEVLNLADQKQAGLQDVDRVKALYRRGLARMAKDDLDRADQDLRAAAQLDGGGPDLRRAMETLRELRKEQRDRQRALWGGKLAASSSADADADAAPESEPANPTPPKAEVDPRLTARAEIERMLAEAERPAQSGGGGILGTLARWAGLR